MKTIIWKELRENLRWAVLALLGLALAEIGTLHQQRNIVGNTPDDLTLCSSTFLLVTSFGCAIVGAALGALQILPELRRDQWAALLHRPVSRGTIFFGKVAAGLLLYLLAASLPLMAAVAYVATPGEFAGPLVPGMLLPAASDLCFGMVFYGAALLVSLHRGAWYGRRALLALAVVPVFLFQLSTRWPFFLPVGAAAIFLAAGYGAMEGNGLLKARPVLGRLCFVFVLFLGVGTGLAILFSLLSLLSGAGKQHAFFYRRLAVTKEGTVLISGANMYGSAARVTTIDGTPVTDERYVGNSSYESFCQFTPLCWNLTRADTIQDAYLRHHPRDLRNYVASANNNNYESVELWYLLVEKNVLEGYDKLSHRCVGFFDREGFHPPGTPVKPFPIRLRVADWNYALPYLFWSGNQLYGFDFSERSMKALFTAPSGVIYGAEGFSMEPTKTLYIGVAWEKGIQFLRPDGTLLFSIPYGHDPAIWSDISLTATPGGDRIFVSYERSYVSRDEKQNLPIFVDELDLHGKVVHSDSAVIEWPVSHPTWEQVAIAGALPPAPVGLYMIYARMIAATDDLDYSTISPPPGMENWWTFFTVLFGSGTVLALGTYWWARRVALSTATAWRWALFVFCFGLAGLVTFRLGASWPIRMPCPKCSRKRSITAEECPDCHQTWPVPENDGTEIFQPVTS